MSGFTRKDYLALSTALAESRPRIQGEGRAGEIYQKVLLAQHAIDCQAVADVLGEASGFDRYRFLSDCGCPTKE